MPRLGERGVRIRYGGKCLLNGQKVLLAALVPAKGDEGQAHIESVRAVVLDAGASVVGELVQRRGVSRSRASGGARAMHTCAPLCAATLIGSGKVVELASLVRGTDASVVVFCNPLTPAQQRNLTRATGACVVSAVSEAPT